MLQKATPQDIALIARIAEPVWHEHYTPIIGQEQVEYMLKNMYSTNALLKQNSEGQNFYFILDKGEKVGFISISKKEAGQWFIHKFYLSMNQQNRQLGSLVMAEIVRHILQEDDNKIIDIRLTVNRKNFKSINFYFKNEFKIESVEDFDIGNGFYMNDFVMVRSIMHQ